MLLEWRQAPQFRTRITTCCGSLPQAIAEVIGKDAAAIELVDSTTATTYTQTAMTSVCVACRRLSNQDCRMVFLKKSFRTKKKEVAGPYKIAPG